VHAKGSELTPNLNVSSLFFLIRLPETGFLAQKRQYTTRWDELPEIA